MPVGGQEQMEVTLLDERGMHCEMYKEEEIDDRRLVIT
jgi:hypothetical protein